MLYLRFVLLSFSLLFVSNTWAQAGSFTLADWPKTQTPLKPVYVRAIMEQAGVHKVSFEKSADFYVAELDKFAVFAQEQGYSTYLKTSVAQNLATIAVIHCDWGNGVAPLEFAQGYLGAAQIEQLKPLFGDAISKLENNCVDEPVPTE
jgi:hypothetical protein